MHQVYQVCKGDRVLDEFGQEWWQMRPVNGVFWSEREARRLVMRLTIQDRGECGSIARMWIGLEETPSSQAKIRALEAFCFSNDPIYFAHRGYFMVAATYPLVNV